MNPNGCLSIAMSLGCWYEVVKRKSITRPSAEACDDSADAAAVSKESSMIFKTRSEADLSSVAARSRVKEMGLQERSPSSRARHDGVYAWSPIQRADGALLSACACPPWGVAATQPMKI